VNNELRRLIGDMAEANPLWGAPRVLSELVKLGLSVSERTVSRLMPRRRRPPSQTWRTFLQNHASALVALDFPWKVTPRVLLHDRDAIFDDAFRRSVTALGLTDVRTAPRSPWQNPHVERLIGSIRRECLDHVIVLNERHLRRVLSAYVDYDHRSRTHLALMKDAPESRAVTAIETGCVVALPAVGGLHHRYERHAA